MNLIFTRDQISESIERLIIANLSVKQFYPSEQQSGSLISLGLPSFASYSSAMKNIPYKDIYNELERNNSFHVKMIDGSLFCFQYLFSADGHELIKHTISFFPSPELPSQEEFPLLYETDDIFVELLRSNIVRFPIRFDYDPSNFREIKHPVSHATFGQYLNCRIPVKSAVSPYSFLLFILRNFYNGSFVRYQNVFEKKIKKMANVETISAKEKEIPYISI
jgi:hypothetical protein